MENDEIKNQMTLFQMPAPPAQEKKDKPQTPPVKPSEKNAPRQKAGLGRKKAPSRKPAPARNLSGQVPDGDVRLTANIREDLHLKLKIAAAKRRTTIGELIEEFVETYL